MTFYGDMQGIATGLLQQFGQGTEANPINLIKLTKGAGPAQNPGKPSEKATAIPGAVARGVEQKYIDRGLAITGDMQITTEIPAMDLAGGAVGDTFEINHIRYKIVERVNLPAAGTPVVYVFIARK